SRGSSRRDGQAQSGGPAALRRRTGDRGSELAAEMSITRDALPFAAFGELLLAELDLPAAPVSEDTRLVEDLGFDSVLGFELLLVIEDWIGALLPEALLGQLVTVGDVYAVYRTRLGHA